MIGAGTTIYPKLRKSSGHGFFADPAKDTVPIIACFRFSSFSSEYGSWPNESNTLCIAS